MGQTIAHPELTQGIQTALGVSLSDSDIHAVVKISCKRRVLDRNYPAASAPFDRQVRPQNVTVTEMGFGPHRLQGQLQPSPKFT